MEALQHLLGEMHKMQSDSLANLMKQQNDTLAVLVGSGRGNSGLTDTRGIGRPVAFKGDELKYAEWKAKLMACLRISTPQSDELIARAEQQAGCVEVRPQFVLHLAVLHRRRRFPNLSLGQRGQWLGDEERPHKYMAITDMEENPYQDDMKWTVSEVSDMCIPDDPKIKNTVDDMAYFDENTWEILDQQLVKEAEKAEIARFKKMGVYSFVSRSEALNDPDGSFVKVKWVRTIKGTAAQPNIRCRLVAQETGYGQRIDELFSGTPSLMSTKIAKGEGGRGIMVMDVKCAFLYSVCRRRIYIELLRQDPKHGAADLVGLLQKAMYGTRDAPQIWAKEVQKVMEGVGFVISMFQPSVYYHPSKDHRCCARGRLLVLRRDEGIGVALRQLGAEVRTEEVTDYEGF